MGLASEGTLGLVLAGGRGTRMGGVDKALIELCGETLIQRALRRLGPQVETLAIASGGDPERFGVTSCVLPDAVPGFAGPLAGVLAGLDHAADLGLARVATVAVDTPFFPCDLVARLAAAEAPVAVAAAQEDGRLRWHGTCALWTVALRAPLRAALRDGERTVRRAAERLGAVPVVFPAACVFFNVNTPEDLSQARDRAAEER